MNSDNNDKRRIYMAMKERKISTLDLHTMLSKIGIEISQRTLQSYLDNDFTTTDDKRLKIIALDMIKNYDTFVDVMKNKFKYNLW